MRWLTTRFVDDWKKSWLWGSVRLHAAATAAFVYMVENPNALNNLAYGIAPRWRTSALLSIAGAWFVLAWVVRVWKGKPNG